MTTLIEPKSGFALEVKKGDVVRITDVEGGQVADFVCFKSDDYSEFLSQANTRINNGTIRITTDDLLYSNSGNVMFKIIEDKVGVHDLIYAPCNSYLYEEKFKVGPRNGCLENLAIALEPYGIEKAYVPNPFNIFMHTHIDESYKTSIKKPVSKKGDYIDLEAQMDCLIAISSCAEDISDCNLGVCTSIEVEVL